VDGADVYLMPWEAWLTLIVVLLMFVGLARGAASPDVLLLVGAVTLVSLSTLSTRFPTASGLAAGFGNEGLLTIGVLFVVAAGLQETGGMALMTDRVLGRPDTLKQALVRLMTPVATLSAVMNNTPVVAMFVPVVHGWAKRTGISPSKLFIPLSFAAVLGGLMTLIGTSTTLVVQSLLIQAQRTDASVPLMGMFTISAVGVPIAAVGLLYLLVVAPRLLPDRRPFLDEVADPRQYTVEMLVQPGGAADGLSIEDAGLRRLPGMYLASIERDGEPLVAVGSRQVLRGGDRLVFVGIVDSVVDLKRIRGLAPATTQIYKLNTHHHDRCLVEAVVSETNPVAGRSIREGRFRTRYDAAVVAVHRNGDRIVSRIGDIVLRSGDTLLLETHPRFLLEQRHRRDFLLISPVAGSQPARHERAGLALAILGGMVLLASAEPYTGVPLLNAALIGAVLMVATRCLSVDQARRSVDLTVLVAIAAALAIGRGIESTGLAAAAADAVVFVFQPLGPWGVLAGIYLVTLVFTELVTNNAAAALAFPVARAAAAALGVDLMPFAIVIAVAASAGFATPFGYQTHMMVYGPGGYRFSDFLRVGVLLDVLVMVVAVLLTPLVFPLR
jgi:di/tricarboxylate transporter